MDRHFYGYPSTADARRRPKVVSIPIHFADSAAAEEPPVPNSASPEPAAVMIQAAEPQVHKKPSMATEKAAVMIQALARGFLTRRSVARVRAVAEEVDRIEKEMADNDATLRSDVNARIRVTEALMAQLLKLDGVRGAREYRRKVIKRAIALQESADAMAATVDSVPADNADESVDEHEDADERNDGDDVVAKISDLDLQQEAAETSMAIDETDKLSHGDVKALRAAAERMATEGETLRAMVAGLCESNARQLEIVRCLSARVESLEREIRRMRKGNSKCCKKKRIHGGVASAQRQKKGKQM